MNRFARSVARGAVVVTAIASAAFAVPQAAHAIVGPPKGWCGPTTVGQRWADVDSAEVNPTLTHFASFRVSEGTTGTYSQTLSHVHTVTTTFNSSVEITSEMSAWIAKVQVKVGFSVEVSTSNTGTESTTMTWTFNQPGYYGLYKGTRAVSGRIFVWVCRHTGLSYVTMRDLSVGGFEGAAYTTYSTPEMGTIRCEDTPAPGTLWFVAQTHLAC